MAKTLKNQLEKVRSEIETNRQRIEALRDERKAIARRPVDRDEAKRRVDRIVERLAAKANDWDFVRGMFLDGRQLDESGLKHAVEQRPLSFAAVLAPDALKTWLLSFASDDGITDADRASKLMEIDRELEATAITEELMIRELEDAGGSVVPRRTDADPALLLAPTEELEG